MGHIYTVEAFFLLYSKKTIEIIFFPKIFGSDKFFESKSHLFQTLPSTQGLL